MQPESSPASPPPQAPPQPLPEARPPADTKAVVALVLGVLGLGGAFVGFGLAFGAPAVGLAALAVRDIRRSKGRVGGIGLALSGMALGAAGSLLFVAWLAAVWPLLTETREGAAVVVQRLPSPLGAARPMGPADPHALAPASPAVELHRDGGPLASQLAHQASAAEAAGQSVLVVTTSAGCDACDEVESAMGDPRLLGALARVRLVDVDVGEFRSELGRLRMDEWTAPWFYLLDARGEPSDAISADEWDDNEAAQIAPVLGAFVRGRLKARRHRWNHGTTL
jgi:hypothetical protein